MVRSQARRKRRPPEVYRGRTSEHRTVAAERRFRWTVRTPARGSLRPSSTQTWSRTFSGRLDSEQHRGLARAQFNRAAPVLPGTAFTSSTLRAVDARVASHIL